jgi:NADH:ubiquinone oxidoreductase subunit E
LQILFVGEYTVLYLPNPDEKTMKTTQEIDTTKVDEILTRFRKEEGSLIPVLQEIQAVYRYLPREALLQVSKGLKIPLVRIYGVVTFYSQFYLTPRGKHVIKSCQGTACHVRGAKGALEALTRELHVEPGGTTKDMNFTLETVACLGTCFLAPVMMIDDDYYGKLSPKRAADTLKKYSPERKTEEA